MMDAGAVVWTEWREIIGQRGLSGQQGILLLAVTFGIVLPLMNSPAGITTGQDAARMELLFRLPTGPSVFDDSGPFKRTN